MFMSDSFEKWRRCKREPQKPAYGSTRIDADEE
jgi:hypothetical protein